MVTVHGSGSGPYFGRKTRPRGHALAENMDLTPWESGMIFHQAVNGYGPDSRPRCQPPASRIAILSRDFSVTTPVLPVTLRGVCEKRGLPAARSSRGTPGGRGSRRAGALSGFSARREPRPPQFVQLWSTSCDGCRELRMSQHHATRLCYIVLAVGRRRPATGCCAASQLFRSVHPCPGPTRQRLS
jgi:hypothetical protein